MVEQLIFYLIKKTQLSSACVMTKQKLELTQLLPWLLFPVCFQLLGDLFLQTRPCEPKGL